MNIRARQHDRILDKLSSCDFNVVLIVHRRYYVEIKCQLDATDDF